MGIMDLNYQIYNNTFPLFYLGKLSRGAIVALFMLYKKKP